MKQSQVIIHSDGGARGNPGPGACAYTIEQGGKLLAKESLFLGKVTNNVAEYQGVILALKWLEKNYSLFNIGEPIVFNLDSELVVKQLNGLYKIKNETLKKINLEIKEKIFSQKLNINFKNIQRSKNKIADLLVNKELDRNIKN